MKENQVENGRVGKEIKLVATLYNPDNSHWDRKLCLFYFVENMLVLNFCLLLFWFYLERDSPDDALVGENLDAAALTLTHKKLLRSVATSINRSLCLSVHFVANESVYYKNHLFELLSLFNNT